MTVLALSRGALTAGAWPLPWQAGVKTQGTSSRCRRQIAWCGGEDDQPLCNLYSVTKGQQAIREFTSAMRDRTGNLPPLPVSAAICAGVAPACRPGLLN